MRKQDRSGTSGVGKEREIALLVVGDDPPRIIRSIAALRRLDGFILRPHGSEQIVDTYFDTPDQRLSRNRIALRTRQVRGRMSVTLKIPQPKRAGVPVRSELELPVGPRSLRAVLELLRKHVDGPLPGPEQLDDALRAAADTGTEIVRVQTRKTQRLLRDVFTEDGNRRVAELGLDRVSYLLGKVQVRLEEVEIEAKGSGSVTDVASLGRALLRRYPRQLTRWAHSKLATGKVLEAWRREGKLAQRTTRESRIRPAALAPLAQRLRHGAV